jgi:hypothetical protein
MPTTVSLEPAPKTIFYFVANVDPEGEHFVKACEHYHSTPSEAADCCEGSGVHFGVLAFDSGVVRRLTENERVTADRLATLR